MRVIFELSESADRYRVRIENHDRGAIAFDEETFFIHKEGTAPVGIRIIVRDRNDREVYTGFGEGSGYSFNDNLSTLWPDREPVWRTIPAGEAYVSPWFSLQDLVQMLEIGGTEPDPKKWKDFRLLSYIQLNDEKTGHKILSETFPFPVKR